MLLIPKVKKKITGFVKDEQGTMSKGNIIKAGILLGSIGASVRIVDAVTVFPLRDGDLIPGTNRKISKDNCLQPIRYQCIGDSTEEGTAPDTMDVPRTTCDTYNYWGTLTGNNNQHSNSGTIVHRNAQGQNSHRNNVGFQKSGDNLVGTHSHHGQHFNIDSVSQDCGTVPHKSNCWHSNHSSGGWC